MNRLRFKKPKLIVCLCVCAVHTLSTQNKPHSLLQSTTVEHRKGSRNGAEPCF